MIKRILIAVVLVGAFVAFDQWSKYLVESRLAYQVPYDIMPFIKFFRTWNDGVAFSMLSGFGVGGLIAIGIIVLSIVLYMWFKIEHNRLLTHLGFALICAGAIGNLIDRSMLGYVIDFILFHTENWSFAIFNVADIYISTGVGAILLDELLMWKQHRNSPPDKEETHP